MRNLLIAAFLLLAPACFAQTGNGCSTNTSAPTGSVQSYGLCNPLVINGRNLGGWIALNRTGDQSNTEEECYDPANVFIENGFLTLILKNLSKTCNYFPAQQGSSPQTYPFSSAFVQWNNFSFTYGDLIVRAKVPGNITTGAWPAIWMLGANCIFSSKVTADNTTFNGKTCNWHSSGSEEIDIYESSSTIGATSSTCNLFYNGGSTQSGYAVTSPSTQFHLYELRWSAGSLQWYLDGAIQSGCTISSGNVPSTPMFLQMNIAVYTNAATTANLASNMQVDYVKVCQPSPCSGNGGNIIFFDDFVTPIASSALRPISRLARLSGQGTIAPSIAPIPGIFAKNEFVLKQEEAK